MANDHGDFIWYELMTSDVPAAADFYGAVLGWESYPVRGSPRGYHLFSHGDSDVAGTMPIPEEATCRGATPAWLGYIGVRDVDAAATEIIKAGGVQYEPPTDIPGVGRFALLADPQGALFYVMRGAVDTGSTSFAPTRAGHCHWNELATSDPAGALAFYSARFGWTKGETMPMGDMGHYQLLLHHGQPLGAVMQGRNDGPPPRWTFYFGVKDIDVAERTTRENGGRVHHGPVPVPGGLHIIIASDPQGAMFGLVGPRKS